jgi:hypothetical protein
MIYIAKVAIETLFGFLCMQNLLIASIADHVLQYCKWANFKIPFTISNSYTFQGLGNHTHFSLM